MFTVSEPYISGSKLHKLVHKLIALVKRTVQNKMDMSIHQTKCKNNYLIFSPDNKYPIHSVAKIGIIIKQSVYGIAVCRKVPTISDWKVFTLNKRDIETEVRFHLPEQIIVYLHLHFQRLQWSLKDKDKINYPIFKPLESRILFVKFGRSSTPFPTVS